MGCCESDISAPLEHQEKKRGKRQNDNSANDASSSYREELAKQYMNEVLVKFDTDYGVCLTQQAIKNNRYIQYYLSCYVEQECSTTCALVTLHIILNAKQVSLYYKKNKNKTGLIDVEYLVNEKLITYIDEDKMIEIYPIYCKECKDINKVLNSGMSVKQFKQTMVAFGFKQIEMIYCESKNETNINKFRKYCKLLSINQVIICNYSLCRLDGYGSGGGHFSSVVGYHSKTDRLLLLDCWTQKSWVKLTELYYAMNTQTATGQYRGYCTATNIPTIDIK